MARVRFVDVTKRFPGGITAVDGLTLEIPDGQFCVLLGPSGSGKTSILRMVAGLDEITRGEIFIGNRMVNLLPPKERDVAMVFQNFALYPHWSVADNLAFGLIMRRFPKNEIERRVNETAEILDISHLLNRLPKSLSGGEKQRVALGRAMVRQPQVFLFDEPLSNLDAQLRVQMRGELSRLHQRLGATMIYVTHDQQEAMSMGERIVVIREGNVQQDDAPQTVYDAPANLFVAGFVGSPPMNLVPGRCEVDGGQVFFRGGALHIPLPESLGAPLRSCEGKEVIFGIRPEQIALLAEDSQPDESKSAELKFRDSRAEGSIPEGSKAAVSKSGASKPLRSKGGYSKTDDSEGRGSKPPSSMVFEGTVELIELLGAEKLAHLNIGEKTILVRQPAGAPLSLEERRRFILDLTHAHFFDPQTEQIIV